MALQTSQVDKAVELWREMIKTKGRVIISVEQTIELKINSLRPWIFPEKEDLDGWECRHFEYNRKQERKFTETDWKPIKIGDHWGPPGNNAMFRCQARMPEKSCCLGSRSTTSATSRPLIFRVNRGPRQIR